MPSEPTRDVTLVELLEAEAKHRLTGDCADHVQYARLRAAAARLRAEMERAAALGSWGTGQQDALARVNGGAGPLAPPMTPATGTGMEPGQRCTQWSWHTQSIPSTPHSHAVASAAAWDRSPDVVGRCSYVHPAAPVSVQEACEPWCGDLRDNVSKLRPLPERWSRAEAATIIRRSFCTPACRDAGHPLNPKDRP